MLGCRLHTVGTRTMNSTFVPAQKLLGEHIYPAFSSNIQAYDV